MASSSGGMSPQEIELCRGVIKTLRSEKYLKFSQLFLFPFSLDQVPGYLDVCPRVMDLQTLNDNLDQGVYKARQDFFNDCLVIFENAIKYHSDKDATKWIVAPAKQMLKITKKEQQKVEKKAEHLGLSSGGGTTKPATPKLKLKLGGSSDAKPKIKIKSPASQGKTPPPGIMSGETSGPPNKKVRLTLKIGKTKTENDSRGAGASSAPSAASPKSTASTEKSSAKLSIKLGGNRGKELPKGIAPPEGTKKATSKKTTVKKTTAAKKAGGKAVPAAAAASKAETTSKKDKASGKAKITLKTGGTKSKGASGIGSNVLMTPARKAQCYKILNGLRRRQAKNIAWFEKPVSDKKIIQDYRAKIKYPMDLSTIESKLDNNTYSNVTSFALDLRRIFGNCMQYNISIVKDSLRPIAFETFETAEQLLTYFLAKSEYPQPAYPPLVFCWKLCMSVLDTLYNLTNPDDKNPTAFFFMFPVAFYFGGKLPPDYPPNPMDFGTITGKLVEGQYSTVEQFENDCKLVIDNCLEYNHDVPENRQIREQATRLNNALKQQLDALNRYVKSPAGQAAQKTAQLAISTSALPKPPIPLLLSILSELREQKYTDKLTKITEPAMGNFEKPVSLVDYPDYMNYVQVPMDLQTVERKIKNGQYLTPEDFEYDMLLMFQNCITYNNARKVDHLVSQGKYGMKIFRRIFSAKMKVFDDPSSAPILKPPPMNAIRKDPPEGAADQGPSKMLKIDTSGLNRIAPRISLSATTISEAQKAAQAQGRKSPKLPTSASGPKPKFNQPVPVHIAIAQVKAQFPLRRLQKDLQSWEASCARFYKELMKHPWISAARPKFIFHVPVSVLFPALEESYAAKIKRPMDLTTVECALLAGNRYTSPEDFINDVALVFSNAIVFNKDGRDIGDPLSCAYYDASIHLLKYTRWLSLELLAEYIQESDYVDEPEEDGLPVSSWKLTSANKKVARSEMEAIVLKEPIEKSLEGERWSWTEAECEKLLKSLRNQGDARLMSYFLFANYPPDYTAFISRPMDWEKVQKTLKKRQYDTIGAVIDDLRLIFQNALKYNARLAGTDTVSGHAYEAAKIMSAKLETAINKCMLTVSDRVERERIDHNNAEREIEAAERAEEERIREQWKTGAVNEGEEGATAPEKVEGSQRIRTAKRIILRRKSDTDFEVPFFDEEDYGQHERSYFEVMKQQKATFERQRAEMVRMRYATAKLGQALFSRMAQQQFALEWVTEEQKKLGITVSPQRSGAKSADSVKQNSINPPAASAVLAKLDEKDRKEIKFSLSKKNKKKISTRKKKPLPAMDWDDDGDDGE